MRLSIASSLLLLVVACGGPAPTPVPPPTPAATPEPTPEPTSATGEQVELTVDTAMGAEDFTYMQTALTAPAGSEITLRLNNLTDPFDEIGHNWVLVKPGQEESVLANGITAGDDKDWLDVDDPGIIAATRLIEGSERDDVTFVAPEPGTYTFVCTFPEHFDGGMTGTLTIE